MKNQPGTGLLEVLEKVLLNLVLVTVKKNQPQLLRDIEQSFVIPQSFPPYAVKQEHARRQTATTKEKNRGRIGTHTVTTTTYAITSLSRDQATAAFLLKHL